MANRYAITKAFACREKFIEIEKKNVFLDKTV